ncbi:ankyrin repeat domain-containing protein [uncultured Legionella sp.]|uniref:ankyrin repeat domain-containing protein n=1 Tax=uncultured Legionella sp. TaxID=210934 RepID=UPI00261013C6|nr:ankyrin repeat domain-containing protein [uncultured Legionella sp.]
MIKLTHNDLLKFGQLLGYPLHSLGLCQGFSGMLMQAILVQEEEQFWARLNFIAKYKYNFSLLTNKIEKTKLKAQKTKEQLNEQDIELLELLAFYDGIELYLMSSNHRDVFNNRYVSPNNLDEVYSLTHSKKLEQNNLMILLDRVYAFNRASLTDYLNDLETVVNNYPNLPILVRSSNHSVLLKYNKHNSEKPWMYVDTNDFSTYPKRSRYYRELNTEELVHGLFNSLSQNSEHIVFNATLVTTQKQPFLERRELEQLRRKYPINPEQAVMYDKYGTGLLYLSCQYGNVEVIHNLLAYKDIKINEARPDQTTPLYIACQNGNIDAIKLLLARKDIKINQARDDGVTPFYIACLKGHIEAIQLLLTHENLDINKAMLYGATLLYIACENGDIGVIKILLSHPDIKVNEARNDGVTPLFIACMNGHIEAIKLLLAHEKIEINKATPKGVTPLFIACQQGHMEAIKLLLAHERIEINKAMPNGVTSLFIACKQGHIEAIKLLLAHKNIKINEAMPNGVTPLLFTCQNGHIEAIKLLLAHESIEINKAMPNGATPLFIACKQGNIEVIKLLLSHKDIDINQTDNYGISPLYIACQNGNCHVVTVLLQSNKINVNCVSLEENTPLLISCLSSSTINNNELFHLLLANNADVFHKNNNGETALDIAFMRKNNEAIEEILTYAKMSNLSLGSLLSLETQKKARAWASLDNSNSLPDVKQFVQKNLPETSSTAAKLSGVGLFTADACNNENAPSDILSEKEKQSTVDIPMKLKPRLN